MTDPFAAVAEAVGAARAAWTAAAVPGAGVDGMTGAALMALNERVVRLRRQVDAVQLQVAAQIVRASRPELGNAGLARQQGFRTPAALIAAATGGSTFAAVQLVSVAEATAPRATLLGVPAPAKHEGVATAVQSGLISVEASAAIIAMLDRVALRAGRDAIAEAEVMLVEKAAALPLDQLRGVLQRAQAWLDPDGVQPREDELRAGRSVRMTQERSGMLVLTARLDPETAAPVKTAIEAIVGTQLGQRAQAVKTESEQVLADDRRTVPQLQADALATICRHVLGCASADAPTAGATVVVRVTLEQLESGRGHATIDGLSEPISIATARRMAADGAKIPWVLGGDAELLDFGRTRRLFSPAQKLLLTERDGGCAMCGLPPGMTQVHHVRWWERDAGPTDLNNGVLLCVRCHHLIHDDGWEIRIEGRGVSGRVWFVPPRHVDPSQTPRLGGRPAVTTSSRSRGRRPGRTRRRPAPPRSPGRLE